MKESYKTLFLSIISTAAALCALVMHTACENFALGNIDDSFEVAAIRPSLTLHRYDLDVVLGSGLTYQGNADISYKWYSNSVNSTEGGALVSTEVTCPISAQDMIGRHYYYVEITVDKDGKRTSKKSNVCVVTVLIPRYEQDNYVSGLYVNGAKDAQVIPNDTSVQEWLADNAQSNSEYAIVLDQNMSFETVTLASSSLNGASNVTVHLFGKGTEQTITPSLTSPVYPLFLVQGGVKLVLDKNITIDGLNINTSATYENLISVKDGGVLEMNDGSKVTKYGAVSNPAAEAPIGISGGSRFIMNGGDIVSNYSSYHSAGVNVENSSFEMHGGTISSNTSTAYMQGGGVSLWASSFEMTGGEISGNTCSNSTGGGVGVNHNYLDPPDRIYSSFTMSGNAKISGNMAPAGGGGVYVDEG
ncbi:MAG: hypothetical protein LBD07_04425, partial [Spirochaetaceae bacterium]|nr:hypothetical protein [Spirochaetaceae bacterium]